MRPLHLAKRFFGSLRPGGPGADATRWVADVLSPAELEYIQSGKPVVEKAIHLPWTSLLRYRQVWPFLIGKMLTDPVWWFYLFWLPSYLERERGQNPLKSALLLAVIYTGSSVGSIGWSGSTYSSRLPLPLVSRTSAVQPCEAAAS